MIPLGYLMDITTNDPQPYLDSLTTGLAILATYYLGKSYLQTWLVWMMVNIGIYAIALTQNMFIIMYLELILLIISIYGIINWSIILKNE
jgi:nicotinamide mononucleotide transporter